VTPILELLNLVKTFGSQTAVNGVSWKLAKGKFYALLGPSGCGKTTTLRMIAGFDTPTSGEIRLDGETVTGKRPFERNVSTVFQNYALFPHLTAAENIEFGLRQHGIANRAQRVADALHMVRMEDKAARSPAQLSGGERQRVALARSLVLEPAVLLLDEPLAALDLQLRKQMRAELKDMQRRTGVTFLFVTHDQEEALAMSDEMAVMNDGHIEQAGSPRELYEKPKTRFVANFLGTVNWIEGVGVRPEGLRIERTTNEDAGTVAASVFLGHCVQVRVRAASGEEVISEQPPSAPPFQDGDRVKLSWAPGDEIRVPA
jgi:ABC-type Fe3+/spermidine/putrescine transport system ATPase subunit